MRRGREGRISNGTTQASDATQQLASAHSALKADASVQFSLVPAETRAPPSWLADFLKWLGDVLEPVGRFFAWISSFLPDAPLARILLWTVLAAFAAVFLWTAYRRLRDGYWSFPKQRSARQVNFPEVEWAPEEDSAIAWLDQADALAAQGRYSEAVHHLLLVSVNDIASRRPDLIRPAITSREIASAQAVPAPARSLFARIAAMVERSLFGGRSVGDGEWQDARSAYAKFALPQAWRG